MARVVVLALTVVLAGCIEICFRSPGMQEREIAAIREIQRIEEAEKVYRGKHDRYGTLAELRTEGFLPPARTAEGYQYRLVPAGERFQIEAWPVEYNRTGRRSFHSDESLQILQSWTPGFVQSSSKPLE